MRTHDLLIGFCAAALAAHAAGCTIDPDADGPATSVTPDTGGTTDAGQQDTGTEDTGQQDAADATDATDATADADAGFGTGVEVPGYEGDWHDDGTRQHRIAGGGWTITVGDAADRYAVLSAADGVVIAENAADNASDGGLFSRFDLVEDTDLGVLLCETTHTAATAEEAAATAAPDAENLALGCNGSAWFTLVGGPEPIEIQGPWTEDSLFWSVTVTDIIIDGAGQIRRYSVRHVDNAAGDVLVYSTSSSDLDPSTWARFAWTRDAEDRLWACGVGLNSATRAVAESTPSPDPTDPANGGCNAGPWSELTL